MNTSTIETKTTGAESIPTCPKCGNEKSCGLGRHEPWPMHASGICLGCWQESPEGIAEGIAEAEAARLQRETKWREIAKHRAGEILAKVVPLEIYQTDIRHPEFNTAAWEAAKGHLSGTVWPWLWSPESGVCKSRIAFLLALQWLRDYIFSAHCAADSDYANPEVKVLWLPGDRLAEAAGLRRQYSMGEEIMQAAMETVRGAMDCRLLILDDFLKRRCDSETVSDCLWEIVRHRHENRLPTVITENIPPDAVQDRLHSKHGAFVLRRLAERVVEVSCTPAAPPASETFGPSF